MAEEGEERCEGPWRPPNPIIQASIIRGEQGRGGREERGEEGGEVRREAWEGPGGPREE